MDEQDFSKAEIAKEKKQKLKNLKKNSSLEEFFCRAVAGKKFEEFWNLGNEGGYYDPLVGHWSKAKSHLLTPWY